MPVDLPPGEWTLLLIGDQWPSSCSLDAGSTGASARHQLSSDFSTYVDHLLGIKRQNLAPQRGITAEDIRDSFDRGAKKSDQIAEANNTKGSAYSSAHGKITALRDDLRRIAEDGNAAINDINQSAKTLAEKVVEILPIVTKAREDAFSYAAGCVGHISDQIRIVLAAQGIEISPQDFASKFGVRPMEKSPVDDEKLKSQINNKLAVLGGTDNSSAESNLPGQNATPAQPNTPGANAQPEGQKPGSTPPAQANTPGPNAPPVQPEGQEPTPTPVQTNTPGSNATAARPNTPGPNAAPAQPSTSGPNVSPAQPNTPGANASPAQPNNAGTPLFPSAPSAGGGDIAGGPTSTVSAPITSPTASAPSIDAPTPATAATAATAGNPIAAPQAPAAMTPDAIAQSFNNGNQTGAPVSVGAEAISTAAASPVHTAPPPPMSAPLADTGAAASASPVFETAHAAPAPVTEFTQTASPPVESAQPVVATPAATITPTTAIAAPPVSPGPVAMSTATPPSSLLAYGADLRPAAAAVPAAPVIPPSAVPGSAPVSPSSGAGPTGSPAVVRQQPTTPTAQDAAAAGLTERAFAATVTGAALGAGSAHAAAQGRLQRLLEAVARQQPQLCWAMGDLEDGGTLLVTDLAGGWVPPDVEIPTGVRLLQRGVRTGGLEAMLGSTTLTAAYRPGQYLTPAKDAEPVTMSLRARDTTAVDDLGWELAQATKWRDGLPRLAHTLAKAVSGRTGCLDSEVQLLRDYLAAVTRSVLAKYPDKVNPAQVGNWQLLATIDALIDDDQTLANYHFAWFQAQVLTREGTP